LNKTATDEKLSNLSTEEQLVVLRKLYEEEREERIKLLQIVKQLQKKVEDFVSETQK